MDRFRMGKRLAVLLLAAAAAGPAPMAWAAGNGVSVLAAGTAAAGEAGLKAGASDTKTGETKAETAPAAGTKAAEAGTVKAPADDALEGGSFQVSGYEIYAVGDSKDTLDVIRKGRQAKAVVYVKSTAVKTGDIKASGIRISRVHDSFRDGENRSVKVTSDKGDNLEFAVTFSRLTYQGKGNELKFKVSSDKKSFPPQVLTVNVAESEESGRIGGGDGDDVTGQPVVKIGRSSPQNPVAPGEKFSLILNLQNTSGDSDIEDLVVSVNPGASFFITEDTNSRLIKRLDANRSSQVRLDMTAGRDVSGPYQTLDIELKFNYYSNGRLTPGSSSQKVTIPAKDGGVPGQPVISVSRGDIPAPILAGQPFTVEVQLQNTSQDKEIRNLAVTLEPTDQISLLEQTDTRAVGTLSPGQTAKFSVKLQAGTELSNAASKLLGLNLKFDYDSEKGPVQGTYGEKLVIPVKGGQKVPGAPTPNIIIQNYAYGERVSAGQVFDLSMDLTNTSSRIPVENLVVSLDTGEGISINSASNTFYVPSLGAGETKREQLKVQALFQSKLQSPKITITFKYEYMDNKERKQSSSSETIAIPVYQPDRFELKSPVFSEGFTVNEEGTISIPYVNKGRGQIFNVEAKLESDIKALEKDLTPGNFESGKSGTLDFVVTPQRTGEFNGQVTVSYEDEAMQVKTAGVPFTFTVEAAAETDGAFGGEEAVKGEAGGSRIKWLIPAGSFGLLFILGALFIRNIRKKKKALSPAAPAKEEETGPWDGVGPFEAETDGEMTPEGDGDHEA